MYMTIFLNLCLHCSEKHAEESCLNNRASVGLKRNEDEKSKSDCIVCDSVIKYFAYLEVGNYTRKKGVSITVPMNSRT